MEYHTSNKEREKAGEFGSFKKEKEAKKFYATKSRSAALESKKSKGHKHNEREATAKKKGYYPHGHKNFGDVYEA